MSDKMKYLQMAVLKLNDLKCSFTFYSLKENRVWGKILHLKTKIIN